MLLLSPDSFKILFQFRNSQDLFLEECRLDIPENRPPGERFQWFHYQQVPVDVLEPLHFEGMGQSDGQQWRQFREGKLVFNGQSAIFTPKNSSTSEIDLKASAESLPDSLWQKIIQFFK